MAKTNLKVDELTAMYKRMREIKSAMEKEHKERTAKVNKGMKHIEARLLQFFEESGQTSAKTVHGTPYISLRETYSVADREVFLDWVKENEAWELLESRVGKAAVEAYKDEHGDLPPGINYSSERKVNVRSS